MAYITQYFIRATRTQIILAFIYAPLVISWGLPISYMSLVGNIIFLPFLTSFLTLSTVLFLTEILAIPNLYICHLLNTFTSIWASILQYGSPCWLIGFPDPGIYWLLLIPLSGTGIFFLTRKTSRIMQCSTLGTVLITVLLLFKYIPHTPQRITIPYKQDNPENKANIQYNAVTHQLIVPQIRTTKNSFTSWFIYQARSELYKKVGTSHINTLILINPTKYRIQTFKELQPIMHYNSLLCIKQHHKKQISYISHQK